MKIGELNGEHQKAALRSAEGVYGGATYVLNKMRKPLAEISDIDVIDLMKMTSLILEGLSMVKKELDG